MPPKTVLHKPTIDRSHGAQNQQRQQKNVQSPIAHATQGKRNCGLDVDPAEEVLQQHPKAQTLFARHGGGAIHFGHRKALLDPLRQIQHVGQVQQCTNAKHAEESE